MAKILVAEDTLLLARLLKRKLEQNDHEVDLVLNGLEAFKLWSDEYDILITDNDMPQKTGLQLAKDLREQKVLTPIILMSGIPVSSQDLKDHGITKFIIKPFSLSVFIETIEEYL